MRSKETKWYERSLAEFGLNSFVLFGQASRLITFTEFKPVRHSPMIMISCWAWFM